MLLTPKKCLRERWSHSANKRGAGVTTGTFRKFGRYGRFVSEAIDRKFGGAEEDRTHNLRIANATLSQLSYRPMRWMTTRGGLGISLYRRLA